MTGVVDSAGRALVRVRMKPADSAPPVELEVWIDTGFTGELVMPATAIATMGLSIGSAVQAVLADGSTRQLDTYSCLVEWFGEWKHVEVVANQGQFPLLGVGLLLDHFLHVDYLARTLSVD